MRATPPEVQTQLESCLLGGAIGDSIGLPAEGLHARRIARFWKGNFQQRLFFGRGMVSDDTEHAAMTLSALLESGGDCDRFTRILAGKLRWWFAALPAGIGLATARSCVLLWLGCNPRRSGVFSAGNGPLMRAPVIAVFLKGDTEQLRKFVSASTRITHSDPRADEAAQLIAAATVHACGSPTISGDVLNMLGKSIRGEELVERFEKMETALKAGASTSEYADSFGRKKGMVSGFAPDTAAVAIYAWLRHRGNFRVTVESVIAAGGDTDTVAFVAGSIAGIAESPENFPQDWINGISDWPINPAFLRKLSSGSKCYRTIWPLSLLRNLVFLTIVLVHGFRRLLPPYR